MFVCLFLFTGNTYSVSALGSAPSVGSTGYLGSILQTTGTNVTGIAGYIELARFTNLPIGVYILSGSTFVNNSTSWSCNLQFGNNATAQNGALNNLCAFSGDGGSVILTTQLWYQSSVGNVYFSGGGTCNFQGIQASCIRIA
jgi:hypothetical protein